tara:strand:- start:584 stop:2593 length:2010 start_codon:yes stop_codon:yes gene_type:complete
MMYRIGVDIGGTFTKTVLVDEYFDVKSKELVPTNYSDLPECITKSIVKALGDVTCHEVELVGFATTHTVNALLEGDIRPVGIVAISSAKDKSDTMKRTNLTDIRVGQGKPIKTFYRFLELGHDKTLSREETEAKVKSCIEEGAEAIVATEAFGIEDPTNENMVVDVAHELGVQAVSSHSMSGTYGLEVRTITAAINASILPTAVKVAEQVESAIRGLGITAPIKVMKCDGGLADLSILRTMPVITTFSGPVASVIGALLLQNVTNGLVIEVGGTSSNVGLIKDGDVTMRYAEIFGYPTVMRSIDIRVLPIGGGNLLKVGRNLFRDVVRGVGPRSARKAEMIYATFSDESRLRDTTPLVAQPITGDPENYVMLKDSDGIGFAPTLTCAANCLGIVPEGDFAKGSNSSATTAMSKIASILNHKEPDKIAKQALDISARKLKSIVEQLISTYKIDKNMLTIYGGGGAASVLCPYLAKMLGCDYVHLPHADVISALGATSMILRDVVEIPADLSVVKIRELWDQMKTKVIMEGANPDLVVVSLLYVPELKIIRLEVVGFPNEAARASDLEKRAFSILGSEPRLIETIGVNRVFSGKIHRRLSFNNKEVWVVIDRMGRLVAKGRPVNSLPSEDKFRIITSDGYLDLSGMKSTSARNILDTFNEQNGKTIMISER